MEPLTVSQNFVDALNVDFKGRKTIYGEIRFDVLSDEIYDKITMPRWDGSAHGSAHAFIERATGALYPAASWRYPARKSYYNLTNEADFMRAIEAADPYGIYLTGKNLYQSFTD